MAKTHVFSNSPCAQEAKNAIKSNVVNFFFSQYERGSEHQNPLFLFAQQYQNIRQSRMQQIQHMTKLFEQQGELLSEVQVNENLSDMNEEAQAQLYRNIDEEQSMQEKKVFFEFGPQKSSIAWIDTKSESSRSKKSQDDDWQSPDTFKRIRKPTKQKNNCPTKNFLQTFKPFILAYLRLYSPEYHSHSLMKRMNSKKFMNMQDFQDIFCDPKLRPVLGDYFLNKNIYRDLMQTRIKLHLKKEYFKRIKAIQQAYYTQKFEAINNPRLQSS